MKKSASPRKSAAASRAAKPTRSKTGEARLAATVKSAIDNANSVILMTDNQFTITYANQSAMKMLSQNATLFRGIWPQFEPERVIGVSIDRFHRHPEHQRRLLSDPKNLPFRTEISVGQFKFVLRVSASLRPNGQIAGYLLEWEDVTEARRQEAVSLEMAEQLKAISVNQMMVEFALDGTILTANSNLLQAIGYSLEELKGKHHRVLVDPSEAAAPEYRAFWEKLGRGEFCAGQYRRLRRDGQEVWMQASYNPIPDASGKPSKVVKFASDITAAKKLELETRRAMTETMRVMRAIAEGDLQESMEGEFAGDFAALRDSVNTCARNLRSLVGQIRSAATVISTSASEISQGNLDLSQRTEEQAASIEETASSMEELTGTVRQNADNARQANQLAAGAREQAEKGGSVVELAVSAMSAINEASKKIADIIGVIDEIAFQTNLLALNAAVEAARAGEQGRGFAVVAAEVRNLAQRSAGAAKEIKALIADSVTKVGEGSRLVNDSGMTLQQIVSAVKKVSDIVAEIAEASGEQSAGIQRIGDAIAQMDQGVQQNAALVEEAAATSASMDEQAHGLIKLMNVFKMTDDGASRMEFDETAREKRSAVQRRPLAAASSPGRTARPSGTGGRPPASVTAFKKQAVGPRGSAKSAAEAALAEGNPGEAQWEEF